jgi:hypothetical protein
VSAKGQEQTLRPRESIDRLNRPRGNLDHWCSAESRGTPIGVVVADLNHAIAEANKARLEFMDEEALDQLWVEIMDKSGRVVAKVG